MSNTSGANPDIAIKQKIVIRASTKRKANLLADIPDGNFTYHNFTCKRPNIEDKYIYNYEFLNYERWTKRTNEMNLPSGLLWDYLEYFGPGYTLEDDIRNIGPDGFGVKSSTHHRVSARLGDEDNEVFDKRSQQLGSEPKKYDDNYFKFYSSVVNSIPISFSEDWQKKQQNIFLMYNQPKNIDYLPYCVTCKINYQKDNDDKDRIIKILNDNELSKFLFLHIKRSEPTMVPFYDVNKRKESMYKTWDLLGWLLDEDFSRIRGLADEIILYDRTDPDLFGLKRYLPRRFRKILAIGQIRQYIKQNLLKFEDVIENKNVCKSSVIGYKVEKARRRNGPAIQTFYLEGHRNNFIDNQISYDDRYFYRVSELRVVVGGTYSYSTQKAFLPRRVEVDFDIEPSIQVIENHVYTFAYKISTPPIYSPHVVVANEELIKNKVKFFVSDFMGNTVKHTEKIEKILETDSMFFENLKLADFIDEDGLARFFSRSNTGNFEVFRIETKPEKYEDFAPGFIGVFSNYEELKVDQEKHATFVDFIEHEKTYYYMFRSLDHYGNPGKPSFVSEVYLIEDADEVIMKYKSYDLYDKKEKYNNTKSFRKYLQIVPAYKHVPYKPLDTEVFNDIENTNTEQNVNCLGVQEGSALWDYNNQNYYIKLRVTSKKTGKKFDLNLRFKQIKN